MKYLAILRDSLREALDTKVFLVMVVLSAILLALVGSFGFAAAKPEDALQTIVGDRNFRQVWAERGRSTSAVVKHRISGSFHVTDIKSLTEAKNPNARAYSFTLTAKESEPFALQRAADFWSKPTPDFKDAMHPKDNERAMPVTVDLHLLEEFVGQQLSDVGDLKIEKISVKEVTKPISDNNGQTAGIYEFNVETKANSEARGWPCDVSILYGAIDPESGVLRGSAGSWMFLLENTLVTSIGGWVTLLVGVIITAFFVPNMLHKGTVDMLISKPIYRPVLLIYKYIGGLVFMFLTSCLAIGGVWAVLGLRTGIWAPGFAMTILTLTFFFAILYAVSTLFGVLTRSPIVSILATISFWFGLFVIGLIWSQLSLIRKDPAMASLREQVPDWAYFCSDFSHAVLPRTSDIGVINAHLVGTVLTDHERRSMGLYALPEVNWVETVSVSLAFIVVALGLACWRFSFKDY